MNYINSIECGNTLEKIKDIPTNYLDLTISDIPYGIGFGAWDVKHTNTNSAYLGTSPAQAKSKNFISRGKPINGWSKKDKSIYKEYYDWCFNDYQMENVYDYGGSDKDDDSEGFTIFNWEENYKDNEYILDFIYESYDKFSELPEIFIE